MNVRYLPRRGVDSVYSPSSKVHAVQGRGLSAMGPLLHRVARRSACVCGDLRLGATDRCLATLFVTATRKSGVWGAFYRGRAAV